MSRKIEKSAQDDRSQDYIGLNKMYSDSKSGLTAFSQGMNNVISGAQAVSGLSSRITDVVHGLGGLSSVKSSKKIRETLTNGFLKNSGLTNLGNFGGTFVPDTEFIPDYFVNAFDEPTYLTFRIEFDFENPRNLMFDEKLLNTSLGSYKNIDDSERYKLGNTIYDYMPEPFLEDGIINELNNYTSSSLSEDNIEIIHRYSAEDYLAYNKGEYGRARLMRKIKMALKDIQNNFPYYFYSIEGLNSLNKIDPKTGRRVNEGELTIKCYEGIDLKITQLLQMIRKVMWDDIYQRWALPDMMRYFSMRIYISEIRTFHEQHSFFDPNGMFDSGSSTFSIDPDLNLYNFFGDQSIRTATTLPKQGIWDEISNMANDILSAAGAMSSQFGGIQEQNLMQGVNAITNTINGVEGALKNAVQLMCISAINHVMPTICLECHMCEFDIQDTFVNLDTLNSTSGEPQEQTIKIKVGQVEDYQVYPLDRNLKVSNEPNAKGYYLDTTLYGMDKSRAEHDDDSYAQARVDGYTGSTVFADRLFDKTFNVEMRNSYDDSNSRDNGVNQDKLYRHMSTLYDDALKSYFANYGFNINDNMHTNHTLRAQIYSEKAQDSIYNVDQGKSLRYKKNSLQLTTGILSVLYSALNAVNSFTGTALYSKATQYKNNIFDKPDALTQEDLKDTLPEIYNAAQAIRDVADKFRNSDYEPEFLQRAGESYLTTLAYSKATRNNALGIIAHDIYDGLHNMYDTSSNNYNAYTYGTPIYDISTNSYDPVNHSPEPNFSLNIQNPNIQSPGNVFSPMDRRYYSTIGQNPDYNRDMDHDIMPVNNGPAEV